MAMQGNVAALRYNLAQRRMLQAADQAPFFSLSALDGTPWERSGPTLLAFIETDCPTCGLTLGYLNRLHHSLDGSTQVVAVSQDALEATRDLASRLELRFPMLLDEDLGVSHKFDPAIVPTLFLLDENGRIQRTIEGFSKADLNDLARQMNIPAIAEPHDGAPDEKPGCMSRHREPQTTGETAPALDLASTRGARAQRIELPEDADLDAYCREEFGDPLPVIPPTLERVERMLSATDLAPDEIIGRVPPNFGAATVEKVSANAVMAGCEPPMMRVLIPLVRAACDERFDLHGLQGTTHFAVPLIIINGPIRQRLGFNSAGSVFSNAARANSTVGRALRLIARNLGGAVPGEIDMSTMGNPGHFSYCIAENEEASPWEPLHVERGLSPAQSAVTLFAAEPPRAVSEHKARDAKTLLRTISYTLATVWSYKRCAAHEALVIFSPEHAATLRRGGMSKADARQFLFENTGVPLREYEDSTAEGAEPAARERYEEIAINGEPHYRKFREPENIHLLVAGGPAGKFSAVLGSWAAGPRGSQMVTYPID